MKWVVRTLPNIIEVVSTVVVSLYVTAGMCRCGMCEGYGTDVLRSGIIE